MNWNALVRGHEGCTTLKIGPSSKELESRNSLNRRSFVHSKQEGKVIRMLQLST